MDETSVRALYARGKALGLAVGAGIALGEHDPRLHDQAVALGREAASAREGAGPRWSEALRACEVAADALRRLLEDDTDEHLSAARASQRALRRAVWRVLECDYEPCGAPAQPLRAGGR